MIAHDDVRTHTPELTKTPHFACDSQLVNVRDLCLLPKDEVTGFCFPDELVYFNSLRFLGARNACVSFLSLQEDPIYLKI